MQIRLRWIGLWLIAIWLMALLPWNNACAAPAVVRAVLFYSPSCGHCHKVMTEDLPPLLKQYGDQLQILAVDATTEGGNALFIATLQQFGIQSAGVPLLVVGTHVLIGSLQIPAEFPGLIEQYLAEGGVDWPDIPGMPEMIAGAQVAQTQRAAPTGEATLAPAQPTMPSAVTPNPSLSVGESNSLSRRLALDPWGNTLSIIVLVVMIVFGGWLTVETIYTTPPAQPAWQDWAVPILALVGIGVASYLAHVETSGIDAVCGPVGDCNTVQQSTYARLFGILPIGVLGLAGYIAILAAWLVRKWGRGRLADLAAVALLGMTAFGLLFSIYLTFLEPFVIGATCAWCLTSSVLMLVQFWLSLAPGKLALARLRRSPKPAHK